MKTNRPGAQYDAHALYNLLTYRYKNINIRSTGCARASEGDLTTRPVSRPAVTLDHRALDCGPIGHVSALTSPVTAVAAPIIRKVLTRAE